MRYERLTDWLSWQEGLHPNAIDLGLDRLRLVMQRLQLSNPACPVMTVAGTKGKGSCVALLESILTQAGYRVGVFTSPHLRRYNERIHVAGAEVSDASLCAAFERIDQARGDISLTYFEFNALAACLCFQTANLDAWILEVGLGGRLDAVNALDADVAIVTTIGLDHTEWLGNDLESIGREKAGIYRSGRPALFGARQMPASIAHVAQQAGARLLRAGHDFDWQAQHQGWCWSMAENRLDALPRPGLAGAVQIDNASVALAALQCLSERLPVSRAAIDQGLRCVHLQGRLQRVLDPVRNIEWLLDVAHNAMSAAVLAQHVQQLPKRRTFAIFGLMADKDLAAMLIQLREYVDGWLVVGLPTTRAMPATVLADRLRAADLRVLGVHDRVLQAVEQVTELQVAQTVERVLVFGSFMTVAPVLDALSL